MGHYAALSAGQGTGQSGFDKDENVELIIDEQEVAHLRRVVDEYLNGGKGLKKIKKGLEADGILTATGGTVWHESVIKKMLQNEKLAGDALLQKTCRMEKKLAICRLLRRKNCRRRSCGL